MSTTGPIRKILRGRGKQLRTPSWTESLQRVYLQSPKTILRMFQKPMFNTSQELQRLTKRGHQPAREEDNQNKGPINSYQVFSRAKNSQSQEQRRRNAKTMDR